MTWVVLIFNVLMLIWLIAGIASVSHSGNCHGLSAQSCNAATAVGTGIGAFFIVILWALGDVILGIIWLVTRGNGRSCPVCGNRVKRGKTVCKSCSYDFKQPVNRIGAPDDGPKS